MRTFITALVAACLCTPAMAASDSFFLEGIFSGGAGSIDVDEPNAPDVDFNRAKVDLTINFGAVNTYAIPYNESQFLNKSSFLSLSYENLGSDETDDVINQTVVARKVFGSGFFITAIGEFDGNDNDDNVYEIRLGQYTDERTSTFAGYVINPDEDVKIYTVGLRSTGPVSSAKNWVAYDLRARYLTEGNDSEYAVHLGVSYYPSFRSAMGVSYEFADGRLTNSHETNLFGEFYFSKNFSFRADYTIFRFGNVDEDSAGASLKIRY